VYRIFKQQQVVEYIFPFLQTGRKK